VISRYNGVAGYDWVAIPLMPYLYAVERPQDVPLFADPKTVAFLRDQYRRKYLAELIPDKEEDEMPGGNWYELVGSAYDRTMYGYQVKTSAKQDEQLILKLNAEPNQSHFRTVSRNCADFAKEVMNFYYPKALHRNLFSDVGIATPKQMAKSLVKYGTRHPDTELSSYVIPQVPGSGPRSTKVRGVVESFVKTKKYMLPTMALHPIIMASVAVVYMGSGTGRFDPARNALVYNASRENEPPIGAEDRRSYEIELNRLLERTRPEMKGSRADKTWGHLQAAAQPQFDEDGMPSLQMPVGEEFVDVGIGPKNIVTEDAQAAFAEQLLEARLQQELRRGEAPKASLNDIARDWKLLQQALASRGEQMLADSGESLGETSRVVGAGGRGQR
jgi:hypothetical protein